MKPWEAPGFRFYTDDMRAWLCDYEPQLAAADCAPKPGRPRTEEARENLVRARAKGAAALDMLDKTRGRG